MRYFRFTVNPLSTVLTDDVVHLRLQLRQSGEMIDQDFSDGMWLAVEDADMGVFGVHLDFLVDTDGPGGVAGAYPFFQEGVFEDVPDSALTAMNSLRVPATP